MAGWQVGTDARSTNAAVPTLFTCKIRFRKLCAANRETLLTSNSINLVMHRKTKIKKLLAVASGGGHWVQLLRLTPAFAECEVVFVTVQEAYRTDVEGQKFYAVPDATRHTKIRLLQTAIDIFWILCKERPEVVISTGAAPGYFAVVLGKLLGARTIWVDSIANVEQLSMSGKLAGRHAHLWLTQWPHLATIDGPQFRGAVL
jgi:UDP-N-acetylglucosamine:LPS N-acetylglucosamine transferase